MTDEERGKAHMIVGALAVQIDGDVLNALGDVAGQISDEEVKERLAGYVIITALSTNAEDRKVEVSATVMISLLAEIRRWRARYREPDQPVH